jgi:peptidoglycan/LPS O-acetylase OafA/YrhL
MKNSERTAEIDILRILAASTIFFHHVGLWVGWPLALWGEYAVATFIYLTSFCAIRYSRTATASLWKYWLSRFKAIYPVFAFISLGIFAASFFVAPHKTPSGYSVGDLVANLLMISGFLGRPWLSEPMWFVPFVLQIYFILPFLKEIPSRWYILPAAFVFSGLACAIPYCLLSPYHAYGICRNWSPIFRMPEVMFGLVLGRARSRSEVIFAVAVYLGCCILAVMGAALLHTGESTAVMPIKGLVVTGLLVLLMSATLMFVKQSAKPLISLMGRASLPFFLLHGTGIAIIFRKFGTFIPVWGGYFVICWVTSILFTQGLEAFWTSVDRLLGNRISLRP